MNHAAKHAGVRFTRIKEKTRSDTAPGTYHASRLLNPGADVVNGTSLSAGRTNAVAKSKNVKRLTYPDTQVLL